jgi:2-dehydro-3-deoxygluconokinase
VVSFGEVMLRLSPPGVERLLQTPQFRSYFGGAEANVAASLAQLGIRSDLVTRVPDNPIGAAAVSALRAEGVGTDAIVRGGDRLGIYFVESGSDIRPLRVVYDRAQSAFATSAATAFDWTKILAGATWFHVSGITPALGAGPAAAALEAVHAAKAMGIGVSLDLNYRVALWTGRDPVPVIRPFASACDLLIGNTGAVTAMVGIGDAGDAPVAPEVAEATARELHATFGCARVALTRRETVSASEHGWSASLLHGATGTYHRSKAQHVAVTDRVGGGDAFAAGLLYALLTGRADAEALAFGTAAGALKLTIPGDFNRATVAEIDRYAALPERT